jgi:hypothetical protein
MSLEKWFSVQDALLHNVVFKMETELGGTEHTHSNEGIASNIVANGNFGRGWLSLFAGMWHAILDYGW